MTVHSSTRRIYVWGIVILMMLLAAGCGHRSSQGVHKYGKKTGAPTAVAAQGDFATGASEQAINKGASAGEGYFPEGAGTFSDLLAEDPLIREDNTFGPGLTPSDSPNDYWENRTRAEQLTSQSGLRDVSFEFDSFQLNEQAKATLVANAEWMKAHPHAEITIEGHCDDRGTASYNHVLGEKRAIRTKTYLSSLGVPAERLHVMSFGKESPACWDSTEPCFQKNRRAHLVLDISVASTPMPYVANRQNW
ncbi:MAG: OmpA family protein [Nitrospirales bacterium]|nr:OmpA family protein [Nitrospirales bacterium]MBA3967373.1 OmpA family protein [Nitrospirales bacterium]